MKKFVKLSLVAAVAVAGLTTANAKPLEEAIKGVDVTGYVAYRYNDYGVKDKTQASTVEGAKNYYKAGLDLTVPAGDDLSMGLSFEADASSGLDTTTTGDTGVDVQLTSANFTYTGLANTSITAGKQAIPTPWTVASDTMGVAHGGTGILAVSTFAPVTLVGAYFNQTDIAQLGATGAKDGRDIYVLGAIVNVAGANLEAMYADAPEKLDSYTLAAGYKFDVDGIKIGVDARHTKLDLDQNTTNKNKLSQGRITVAAGMFDGTVRYGKTGKTNAIVAFDPTAKTAMEGWNTNLNQQADAKMIMVSLGAKVLPSLHISANYNDVDAKAGTTNDAQETYAQFKYTASKALSTYIRLGEAEVNTVKSAAGRLHVEYKF